MLINSIHTLPARIFPCSSFPIKSHPSKAVGVLSFFLHVWIQHRPWYVFLSIEPRLDLLGFEKTLMSASLLLWKPLLQIGQSQVMRQPMLTNHLMDIIFQRTLWTPSQYVLVYWQLLSRIFLAISQIVSNGRAVRHFFRLMGSWLSLPPLVKALARSKP